jgi:hypothetical protein
MPSFTESQNLGDLLKFEEDNLYSREEITVTSGQNIAFATVVARITGTGNIVTLNSGGPAGNDIAVGIIADDVNASTAAKRSWMIARHAIVSLNAVIWPAGTTTAQMNTAIAQLKALGIILRKDA